MSAGLLNHTIKRHGVSRDKEPFNTIWIPNTNLNMILFSESCCGVYRLAFPKNTSNRIEMRKSCCLIYFMNCLKNGAIKLTE